MKRPEQVSGIRIYGDVSYVIVKARSSAFHYVYVMGGSPGELREELVT